MEVRNPFVKTIHINLPVVIHTNSLNWAIKIVISVPDVVSFPRCGSSSTIILLTAALVFQKFANSDEVQSLPDINISIEYSLV